MNEEELWARFVVASLSGMLLNPDMDEGRVRLGKNAAIVATSAADELLRIHRGRFPKRKRADAAE